MALLALATGPGRAGRVEELIASLSLSQHITQYGVGQDALRRAADKLAGKYPAADLLGV